MFLGKPLKTLEKMLSVARRARKHISKERNWGRGKLAIKGLECHPRARTACAWCVVGSLQVSTGDENIIHSLEALTLDVVDDAYYDDAEISKLRILKLFQ